MSASQFGANALSNSEFQMSTEDRMLLGLDQPEHPAAMSLTKIDKVTNSRIRYALAELLALNVENMNVWIRQVAAQNPARAIELMLELAQFTTPKLKAIAMDVRTPDDPSKMSLADLARTIDAEE